MSQLFVSGGPSIGVSASASVLPMNIQDRFPLEGTGWISFLSKELYKESACNAEDSDSIPMSGRYPGEGKGYPLQYPWTSLVSDMVKNPPAMWETWF